MISVPKGISKMVRESDALVSEIRMLKAKKGLSVAEWKRLVNLQLELSRLSPAIRFVWINGEPVADIPKILMEETNNEQSTIS